MSSTNNNDCPDLTPNTVCNDSCCPDYEPQDDWCKAFNKRTLDQQKKTQQTMIDGMWLNLEDARNTIGQAEQYLAIIYELLLAIQDQIIKVSSFAGATEGDIESANSKIVEFLKEIDNVAGSANYNGRRLLISHNANTGADAGDFTAIDNDGDGAFDGPTDTIIANDNPDSPDIIFRFMGCIGFCRTVDAAGNDFTYSPPRAGTGYLFHNELTQTVDVAADGSIANVGAGLNTVSLNDAEHDHETSPPVHIADSEAEDIDTEVTKVNCAIKDIGVELDKLRAYRYVLCAREKQIKICKNGQDICNDHKSKL
jgi:flagellin-like hook-associated protein FlgL